MSPLVEYLGNASPQDNTEVVNLAPAEDGQPRSISRGGRALLSGRELQAMAANFQVRVIEDTDEKDPEVIPTEMPSGYDENGYKEGEAPTVAVFTAEAYPDEGSSEDPQDPSSQSSAPDENASAPSGTAAAAASPATPVTPSAQSTSSPPAPPASSEPSSSSASSSQPSPDSPGATG